MAIVDSIRAEGDADASAARNGSESPGSSSPTPSISHFGHPRPFVGHFNAALRNLLAPTDPEVQPRSLRRTGAARRDPHLQNHNYMKRALSSALIVALTTFSLNAQTKVTPPSNKYSPAQDVELGLQAAREARQQLPIMRDDAVSSYVERLGERLTAVIPSDLQHPEFRYTFETVNVREINAFALPGGPMFVNRGMIEAASSEGEVVGVMAHELSHVLLRHGTAQASKAGKYQLGQVAGAVIGAIIGGTVGSVVAQGTQFGLGTAFLRFGREYERQADIMGAQLMARAGYDPREMASMFRTIEKQGRSNGPEWLSDHPNPGNRSEYIEKEAASLRVSNPISDRASFDRVKSHLRSLPRAPSSEEVARSNPRSTRDSRDDDRTVGTIGPVQPPSSRYREYNEGDLFRISVPNNWRELPASTSVTFAPNGAFGQVGDQNVFTHGVEVGIVRNQRNDLPQATDDFIQMLGQSNRRLSRRSDSYNAIIDGRRALQTQLDNVSDATGQPEVIQLITTQLRDGTLFYMVGVAPDSEYRAYEPAFQQVVRSIRLNDR
jgi:Zn-dependent protease with chaperone function